MDPQQLSILWFHFLRRAMHVPSIMKALEHCSVNAGDGRRFMRVLADEVQ